MSIVISSCKLDLLDNPNAVTTNNTDINYLASQIQVSYATHFNQVGDPGMRLTRMLNAGAAIYDNAVTPGGLDGTWTTAYAGILNDVKTLIPLAEQGEFFIHAGVARVVRASVLMNFVDIFGDVPYTEALDPSNFNPKVDGGATIYTVALADLDKAIENFNAKSKSGLTVDLYYGGTIDNWIRAANTLKLKIYLNRKLIDAAGSRTGINTLIAGNKLISTTTQNFTFKYGSNQVNPDNRHPRYAGQYSPTGGGDYQSNAYMGLMYDKKDPRIRAYFYRQVTVNSKDVNEIRCITNQKPNHYAATDYYCLPTNVGYWGRDHLSNEGIPPDGLKRTAWGLYPAGGLYDNDAGRPVALVAGAAGAGIQPMLMSSFTDFMLAEAALTLGTNGEPRTLLESAIRKSMADVRAFMLASAESSKITAFETSNNIVWADQVNSYVQAVLTAYDAAASTSAKLNVIATEYWFALYGNGIEAYNLYRRTGMPLNLQPALDPNPGSFIRSFYYPTAFVSRNVNAKQKANMTTPVFWDNNPASLFK
ncbi:SusD/RagB family nutrient-binding outer membrane lipoprotein [Flectobacillus sp. BAB-3569]|uniref:SusD/RagB family nutrient-binding outer membrane lipoprotein n=2 Tax=unclassified Flectobacillus TaxID=2621086 RepID=UPI001E65580F|nr:SusD/RagB family nutrient-binding outer membrane lipoprotein [Flectobacillus sp. BAB-3569]